MNLFQGMKIRVFEVLFCVDETLKLYSYDMVDCSRPFSGFGGSRLSLRMKVYCLSSAFSTSSSMPSYSDRFHFLSSPVVRWLAKPAPPRAMKSRAPWNVAIEPEDKQLI